MVASHSGTAAKSGRPEMNMTAACSRKAPPKKTLPCQEEGFARTAAKKALRLSEAWAARGRAKACLLNGGARAGSAASCVG